MWLSDFGTWWLQGIQHVLPEGIDHILFMLALILRGENISKTILRCTLFTLGHALSMALVLTGILPDLASIVEPLIAASIVIASVGNLQTEPRSYFRNFIILLFGFIHGCGFASALQLKHPELTLTSSLLLGFNLGVETLQAIMILCITLAAHYSFSSKDEIKTKVYKWLSVFTAMAGLYLLLKQLISIN